jgi:hypothetical protein
MHDPNAARREAFLAGLNERMRERALAQLASDPTQISEWQWRVIPDEIRAHQAEQRTLAERQQRVAEQRAAQQAAVTDRLVARNIHYRTPAHKRMAEHAVELALTHGVVIERARIHEMAAVTARRCIKTPPVTNVQTYVACLHELGHVVDPEADGRQQRYLDAPEQRIAPRAEVAAWRFAVRTAYTWSSEMHDEAVRCLSSYAGHATTAERVEMIAFVKESAAAVREGTVTAASVLLVSDAIGRGEAFTPEAVTVATEARAVRHRGAWDPTGHYVTGDAVVDGGQIWVVKSASFAIGRPGTTDYWVAATPERHTPCTTPTTRTN